MALGKLKIWLALMVVLLPWIAPHFLAQEMLDALNHKGVYAEGLKMPAALGFAVLYLAFAVALIFPFSRLENRYLLTGVALVGILFNVGLILFLGMM